MLNMLYKHSLFWTGLIGHCGKEMAVASECAIWDLNKIKFIGVMGKNTPIKVILSKQKLII
jgi:hypothetical protein